MQDDLDRDLAILDELESAELAPLSWGLVDGGFGPDELLDELDRLAEQFGDDRTAEEIRASLQSRALLTEASGGAGRVWRTRMAETVRLTVRLRQLFPNHLRQGGWRGAPTLVSDYRFLARGRRFPARDLTIEEFRSAALAGVDDSRVCTAVDALTAPESGISHYSAFQARATSAVLSGVHSRSPSATLISAGTGAGKTKAFYLPALAHLSAISGRGSWTKLLAIYPRNELLKDQLQKALAETRALKTRTGVQLTLGAFFGPTPLYRNGQPKYWLPENGPKACPFLVCPECSGTMFWADTSPPSIRCGSCAHTVGANELLLTQQQMQSTPPDILLTTTEMMNRHLSSDYSRHIFGAGQRQDRRPRFLLLDEVHTYTGTTGAHIALLLRRWRSETGRAAHAVGLSATVVDGAAFLSQIVGVPEAAVTVVEPDPSELVERGKEYVLAVRGDPASDAALLSTTIQTAMLLRRALDRPSRSVSDGAFGTKTFVFTDDLDVTNRLFHFLRNAEGLTDRGRPDPRKPNGSLANLRSNLHPDYQARARHGQAWDLCHEIGHDLGPAQPSRVELTSSQNPGLEKSADIVVATASLEVGLDDDTVGAVVQHKAPKDAAAFIQRRGRAGRQTRMRPWTAVVLSDYGRDRRAFASWETLFDPILHPIALPVRNRHILRIQATYCLLEWLSQRLRDGGAESGYIWRDLRDAKTGSSSRRKRIAGELEFLLEEPVAQSELIRYTQSALGLPGGEVERLMWEPPRAVLASVVPTLLRRLQSDWLRSAPGGSVDFTAKEPLPDFLPSALFAQLLVPEVQVVVPQFNRDAKVEPMGVLQALSEFAPGRVTHRFAPDHSNDRLWIPAVAGAVSITDYMDVDSIGAIRTIHGEVRMMRPRELRPEHPQAAIDDSSNARPIWASQYEWVGRSETVGVPAASAWRLLFNHLEFAFHQGGGRVIVDRAALGSEASVAINGTMQRFDTRFHDDDGPVALGARMDVDAFRLTLTDPGHWSATYLRSPSRQRSLRLEWFRECVRKAPALAGLGSSFLLEWLAEVASAIVIEHASRNNVLSDGTRALSEPGIGQRIDDVLTVIFQSIGSASQQNVSRLQQELRVLASTPQASDALRAAADQLLNPSGDPFEEWLRNRFAATVAGAVVAAISLMDSEVAGEDLIVDISSWSSGKSTLTFCEAQPGGTGVVERVFMSMRSNPRRFWRLLDTVAATSDAETDVERLERVVDLACTDDDVADRIASLRTASGNAERITNWQRLNQTLGDRQEHLSRSGATSFSLRLLRAGTGYQTDLLLQRLLSDWRQREEELGIEISHRLFAYLASDNERPESVLGFSDPGGEVDRTWRFNAILSLLWPRGGVLREQELRVWSPYSDLPPPDRALLDEHVAESPPSLYDHEAFSEAAAGALAERGLLRLASTGSVETREALVRLLARPVEAGVLEVFPRVVGARESQGRLVVELEVAEVLG